MYSEFSEDDIFQSIFKNIRPELKTDLIEILYHLCQVRSSQGTRRTYTRKSKEKNYNALVLDPCYSYSKRNMEAFFSNEICSFLFLYALDYIKQELSQNASFDKNLSKCTL